MHPCITCFFGVFMIIRVKYRWMSLVDDSNSVAILNDYFPTTLGQE